MAEYKERLAYLALRLLFPDHTKKFDESQDDERYVTLHQRFEQATWSPELKRSLDNVLADPDDWDKNSDTLKRRVRALLGDDWLIGALIEGGLDVTEIEGDPEPERLAAGRLTIGHGDDSDRKVVAMYVRRTVRHTKQPGMHTGGYVLDRRNLPDDFQLEAFLKALRRRFQDRCQEDDEEARGHFAYVAGSLIRNSYLDPDGPGFAEAFNDTYDRGFVDVATDDAAQWIAKDVYARVAQEVSDAKGGKPPTYQEVAAVSDEVLRLEPVDDNFRAKVVAAHTDFVARTPVYDSLNLPDIVTDDTAKAEVEPANVRAVSMIYAAGHLEPLIQACDIAAQEWSDGFIPVGESAGQLFDAYVWNARDRLDAAARQIQTDRIDGLDDHLLRFCSATSERDRSRYLSEYLAPNGGRRSAQPRDAAVRKAARDLLAYASLHGWAYAQFASRRLANHVRECTDIVTNAEVQKAYGVQGPWQLVERIHQMAGGTPLNIAKDRTLASTGKAIVDLLASKAAAVASSLSSEPLFPSDSGASSVFTAAEYDQLLNLVENWLAAKGIDDEQRRSASRVVDSGGITSLPGLGGMGGMVGSNAGMGGFDANQIKDQLMQMVASGRNIDAGVISQLIPNN